MQKANNVACGKGKPLKFRGGFCKITDSHADEAGVSNKTTEFAIDNMERNGSLEPYEGMKFESEVDAHLFYNEYAKRTGFNTCVKHSRRSRNGGSLIFVEYGCTKHGFKKVSENTKSPRPCIKTNCKGAIKVKRGNHGVWIVVSFSSMHNHETDLLNGDTSSKHDLETNKFRKEKETEMTSLMNNVDKQVEDGMFNLPRKVCDMLGQAGLKAVYEHFLGLQKQNPNFFYAVDFDQEATPRCILWIDAKCRTDYSRFGDIIIFDTIFLINSCRMTFTPFVGVNHHGQTVILGCALIKEETKDSFAWLFKTWLAAMYGKEPLAIFTDFDAPIKDAISEVFHGTRHHFCLWRILRKLPQNLSHLCQENSRFVFELKECIYKSLEVKEFEENWWKLIEGYDFVGNEWLASLFEERERWAPIYLNDSFFAGISTLQRGENIDTLFNAFVSKQFTLKQFVDHFELTLRSSWLQEAEADYETFYTSPLLKTTSPFEAQLASIYTRTIFMNFQVEITGIPGCFSINAFHETETVTYIVRDSEAKMDYKVSWNKKIVNIFCQCRTWELHGYLCRHAMLVLLMSGVNTIPSHYICSRWTMNERNRMRQSGGTQTQCDRPESRILRFNDLCRRYVKLAEEGSMTEDGYHFAKSALEEAIRKIVDLNSIGGVTNHDAHVRNSYNMNNECNQIYQMEVNNPTDEELDIYSGKESPKRTKPAAEKRKRASYTCSSCKMTGHNSSACTESQRQEEQQRVRDFFTYGEI